MPKEQLACWEKIRTRFGLESAAAPDCKAGYEKSAQEMAKGRCQAQNNSSDQCLASEITLARRQANESPSVVSYAVEVLLRPEPLAKAAGGDMRC